MVIFHSYVKLPEGIFHGMVASKFEDALLHFHVQKRRIIMNYHQIHNDTQMFETDNSSRHIGPFSSRTSKHWMDHLQENHIFVVKKRSKRRFPIYLFPTFPKFLEVRRRWTPYWNPSIRGQRLVTGWWIGSLRKQIPGRWVHVGDLLTHLVFKW